MYEQFRSEVMSKLTGLDTDVLAQVLSAMDSAATHYTIQPMTTDIIPYEQGLPDSCKVYLVTRSIQGLRPRTVNLYHTVLTRFFSTIRKQQEQLTANDIRVWLFTYESANHVSKRTLELYRMILNGYFVWATTEGRIAANPMTNIKSIRYQTKPRKAMDQLQLEYIRKACMTDQESAIVEVLYSTGCRISELSGMKKSDVDWHRNEVKVLGKGGKYRTCYLNAKAVVALTRYLSGRTDDDEHLIVSRRAPHKAIGKGGLQKIIRIISGRVSDKLTVPVTPHIFRHTTATQALQHGMPVQDVQKMLGHASLTTTMVYAEVAEQDVKAAHVRCVV